MSNENNNFGTDESPETETPEVDTTDNEGSENGDAGYESGAEAEKDYSPESGATADDCYADGLSAEKCIEKGHSIKSAIEAGYGLGELHDAGASISSLKEAGATLKEMRDSGISTNTMHDEGVSYSEMRDNGIHSTDMLNDGATCKQIHEDGVTIETMHNDGVTYERMHSDGISAENMHNEKVPAADLHGIYNPDEMKKGNYIAIEMRGEVYITQGIIYDGVTLSKKDQLFFEILPSNTGQIETQETLTTASIITANNNAQEGKKLVDSGKVTFDGTHSNKDIFGNYIIDDATAQKNIEAIEKGENIKTSEYGHAKGALVECNSDLLRGLNKITDSHSYNISEIAGGEHEKPTSDHYNGRAVDVNYIDGKHVGVNPENDRRFIEHAKKAGLKAELHGRHIHIFI